MTFITGIRAADLEFVINL